MQVRRSTLILAFAAMTASTALAGCGGGDSGGKKTVKIGFQGPLSGDNAQLGINALDGAKVAIKQANDKGDLPYKLELVQSDDQGSADQGQTAAQKLIDDGKVVAVVGPVFSGATKAAEPNLSAANLLSVTPSATNPGLTSLGFKTFFRLIPSDAAQGKGAADYLAKGLQAKKVFSLDDKSEYGTGLSRCSRTS